MFPELRCGDIFCTRNPMALGKLIRIAQTFNSTDNSAAESHSGIISSPAGETFEAVWTVRSQNLFVEYGDQHVLIGRHREMTQERFDGAFSALVQKHSGKPYPFLRLPLFGLMPRLTKYIYWGRPVCSELTFKLFYEAGLIPYWKGVSPDYISDAIRNWDAFDVVFDDKL